MRQLQGRGAQGTRAASAAPAVGGSMLSQLGESCVSCARKGEAVVGLPVRHSGRGGVRCLSGRPLWGPMEHGGCTMGLLGLFSRFVLIIPGQAGRASCATRAGAVLLLP